MHNNLIEIAPSLYVLGVGGSAPAYDNANKIVWEGYPSFYEDLQINKAISKLDLIPSGASV